MAHIIYSPHALRKRSMLKEIGNRKNFYTTDLKEIKPLNENQEKYLEALYSDTPIVLGLGFAGTGKAQPNDRLIKTPYGWKPMGEIEVGDEITAPDGTVTYVTGVFPQGVKKTYKVVFEDGRETECCNEHLWKVQHDRWKNKFRVLTTEEVKDKIELFKNTSSYRKFRVPLVSPELENPLKKDVLIDPYIMGLYLGDGSSVGGAFKITSVDQDIVEQINKRLIDGYKLSVDNGVTYRFVRENNNRRDPYNYYIDALSNYGIYGLRSWEKYIPVDYVDGLSKEEKLDLLCGLMDSDGEVDSNGGVYYHTTSDKLRRGFIELLRSLGGIAYTKERYTQYEYAGEKRTGRLSYRVRVRYHSPKDLFKLERKRQRVSENGQYTKCNLAIESIEPVEDKECTCISVAHEDQLYITDDYIVTHNTAMAIHSSLYQIFDYTEYDKLYIIRNIVETGQGIGFLPGDLSQKLEPYEAPYRGLCQEFLDFFDPYDHLKNLGYVEFIPPNFIRGTTLEGILLLEESQNYDYATLRDIISRAGPNTKIVINGDIRQDDLQKVGKKSGLSKLVDVLNLMPYGDVAIIDFGLDDIVRSGVTKNFLIADYDYEKGEAPS